MLSSVASLAGAKKEILTVAGLLRVPGGEATGLTTDRMRIVVADEHDLVREGRQHLFGACGNMTVVGVAADAAGAPERSNDFDASLSSPAQGVSFLRPSIG